MDIELIFFNPHAEVNRKSGVTLKWNFAHFDCTYNILDSLTFSNLPYNCKLSDIMVWY